jgi:hypothetical protein
LEKRYFIYSINSFISQPSFSFFSKYESTLIFTLSPITHFCSSAPPKSTCLFIIHTSAKGPSTWWLEGAGGTPQVGGSTPGLGLKKSYSPISLKAHGKAQPYVVLATGPCVWVGKAHFSKHKLRTGPWVVLTGNGPLCMGGCGFRGILSACVRRLLLNIMPWRRSFPYRRAFL